MATTSPRMPLENTPDAARLADDAALKAAARGLCRATTSPASIPASTRFPTSSWRRRSSPSRPSAARAGQPSVHRRAFARDGFCRRSTIRRCGLVRSPEALIERLDNGTCQGCHQSGSTAGFHFIGLDDDDDLAAEPHRGRHLAAFPRRACRAARPMSKRVALDAAAEPLPAAVLRAAGRLGRRRRRTMPTAEITMPCMMPEDARKVRRSLAMRRRHGLHAARRRLRHAA